MWSSVFYECKLDIYQKCSIIKLPIGYFCGGGMKIRYESKTVEKQCTSVKAANKLFGGQKQLTVSLMARMESLKAATNLKDIVLINY